jgi:hypothetical protein
MASFCWRLGGIPLLFVCAALADAQAPPRQTSFAGTSLVSSNTVRIPRVTREPRIEDYLDSSARTSFPGQKVSGFRQNTPGDGAPVSEETSAYLAYDDKNLYVGFICHDAPGQVRAPMAKREDIDSDDHVVVYLDTFHDTRRAYVFASNPLGVQLDGIFTEDQGNDTSFDTFWRSEGRLTPTGYVVWMAIPFKSLRFSTQSPQTWGILLGRSIHRKNEISYWPFLTRRVEGFASQFGTLEGLENISPGRNMQFIPYGMLAPSRFLDQSAAGGPNFRTKVETRAGLDGKIVLKDAITMDLAINPDFSQVESDEPQVTVNQRFEVFFPEKRPFFLENAGFFVTPINLFFSRRVADPQFGLRITGKHGPWTFGGFGIDDRQPTFAFVPSGAGSGPFAECNNPDTGRAAIGVARVQREFGNQSMIGVLLTTRDAPSCANHVASIDTRLKLNPNWVFTGQIMRSFTRRNDASHVSGPAYWAQIRHDGKHFFYVGRYSDRSPDFRAHLGFIPRVDIRDTEQYASYTWRPERRRILSFGPGFFAVVNWDRTGRVQDWIVNADFSAEFTGQTRLSVLRYEAFELFQNLRFRKHYTSYAFSSEWLKWLSLSGRVQSGNGPDYFPGSSLTPFLGNSTNANFGFTLRPEPRLRFDQTYIYSRLGTREGSTPAGFSPGAAIFNNHIVRSKLNVQFTRALSVRAILDYNSVLPNPQLVQLRRQKSLKGDLLFTYLLHPGTALYIGYSDLYENVDLDSVSLAPLRTLRQTNSPTTSTGRLFFVKLSYLFRF